MSEETERSLWEGKNTAAAERIHGQLMHVSEVAHLASTTIGPENLRQLIKQVIDLYRKETER